MRVTTTTTTTAAAAIKSSIFAGETDSKVPTRVFL